MQPLPAHSASREVERARFLLDASRILLDSHEYEVTLARVARLAVPRVADLCVIELSSEDGTSAAVEVAHEDTGVHTQVVTIPMAARGRAIGALTIGVSPERGLGAEDLRMAQDLAERTAMAVANAREYLEAKNAVRTREDLLGIVSHDLRNPLNVTLMKCAMMLRDSSGNAGNDRLRRDVETIERATRRMDRLLKDLQDFSAIQTGHLAIERRSELAVELVDEVFDSARALAGKRKIELQAQGLPEDLRILCDRERVLQVCMNLISNALKFTPDTGSVALEVRFGPEGLVFTVRDTGVGIAPDELPYVFQKYWRVRSGARGGVGLGLFIARALVTEHGGRIWAESEKGVGSTFTVTLPAGPASTDIDARRILIVDDDVDLRRELGEVLATEGRPVAFAADGRQAISYLKSHARPALVLLDLMMPVMDGWEFCATVRADPELAGIPIVVLSCLERHEGGNGATRGVAGFLRKPIQLEKLLDAVSSVAPASPPALAGVAAPAE